MNKVVGLEEGTGGEDREERVGTKEGLKVKLARLDEELSVSLQGTESTKDHLPDFRLEKLKILFSGMGKTR